MTDKIQQIGEFAAKLVQGGMVSDLTWDETIAAFGIAAKALAHSASCGGDGSLDDCQSHAKKRFAEGFAQDVQVTFAAADLTQLKRYEDDPSISEAILENANWRVMLKMH